MCIYPRCLTKRRYWHRRRIRGAKIDYRYCRKTALNASTLLEMTLPILRTGRVLLSPLASDNLYFASDSCEWIKLKRFGTYGPLPGISAASANNLKTYKMRCITVTISSICAHSLLHRHIILQAVCLTGLGLDFHCSAMILGDFFRKFEQCNHFPLISTLAVHHFVLKLGVLNKPSWKSSWGLLHSREPFKSFTNAQNCKPDSIQARA